MSNVNAENAPAPPGGNPGSPSITPWLLGCGVIGVLGVGLCGGGIYYFITLIFAVTQPVVDASDEFLAKLGQGKFAEAYASTNAGYRRYRDKAKFAEGVKKLGLDEFASVVWNNRQINNYEGLVEGTVTTKNGTTKPISIKLIYEHEKWRVTKVWCGGVELGDVKGTPLPIPSAAEVERLVRESLLDFNAALQAKDFSDFYAKIAELWKKETSPADLQMGFQGFIDDGIDLKPIADVEMELTEPVHTDKQNLLVVKGVFPAKPSEVQFELKYLNEKGVWKLAAIDVTVR